MPSASDIKYTITVKTPRILSLVTLIKVVLQLKLILNISRIILTGENRSNPPKTCSNTNFYSKNLHGLAWYLTFFVSFCVLSYLFFFKYKEVTKSKWSLRTRENKFDTQNQHRDYFQHDNWACFFLHRCCISGRIFDKCFRTSSTEKYVQFLAIMFMYLFNNF